MNSNLFGSERTPLERPVFLTVLCVLSFINGGMNIVFNIPSLFLSDFFENYVDFMKQIPAMKNDAPPILDMWMNNLTAMMERLAQNFTLITLSTILLALLSVTGVWLMWNLKKTGFLFYVTAQVLWTILPLIFLGGNIITVLSVFLGGIFTIAFIILYAIQLKHMA